jgi:DNA modification methylase
MSNDHSKILSSATSMKDALTAKGRRRRERLTGLAAASSAAAPPIRNDVLPKLELVEVALGDLVFPPRKLRKNDAVHIREVATAISSLGFCDPVLTDEHNCVLDGMIRVEAAKSLGLSYIPCIRANHLTASEHRLLRLALNRLGEKGSWDFDELKLELEELVLDEVPIEITGFSMLEVDQIVLTENPAAFEAGPLAPDPDARPVAQFGDVFSVGKHRVICGDATDPCTLAILMADDEARLLLTDEPYNVPIAGHVTSGLHREFVMGSGEMNNAQFRAFNVDWMSAAIPHVCDGGLFGTFIDWRGYAAVLAGAEELGLSALNLIVWGKTNAGMGSLFRSQHELLPLFKKGKVPHVNNVELGKHGRWRSNLWTYPGASSMGSEARKGLQHHPTVKPVAMLEDALLDMTMRSDIVLDPFLGSGSTLIAAERTDRRCRGLELDPLYVDVILRRYEAATGRRAVLEMTGETYAELALRRQADTEDRALPLLPSENATDLQLGQAHM